MADYANIGQEINLFCSILRGLSPRNPQVVGNPGDAQLWWFADGRAVGESSGARPFAVALGRGEHVLTCATIAGITSSVRIKIQ